MGKTLINNKYNRKRNLFPYTEKILPSGFIKPIFNHLALPKYNELIQLILKTAQENNIKQNLLIKTWNKKTQIPLRKAKNILNGTEEIELWEYILLAEILEINIFALPKYNELIQLILKSGTLSGGEAQRIRLASQVETKLVGALYVLDEPTIGLHQRDNELLVNTLRNLCDIGNTIIVVEHDENTILALS